MKCEAEYCIYNRDFNCIAREIEINSIGMCGECIMIFLEKELLEKEKEKQLAKIENQWNKNTKNDG